MGAVKEGVSFMMYPRGFIGAASGTKTERRPRPLPENAGSLPSFLSNALRNAKGQDVVYNQNAQYLYECLVCNEPYILTMNYHDEVVRTAFDAFGTSSFTLWFAQQYKSPVLGDMHQRFLDDTLQFLTVGRRDMSLITWSELLGYSDNGEQRSKMSEAAQKFFTNDAYSISSRELPAVRHRVPCDVHVTEIVRQWVSQPGGLEDLVQTLYILFGAPPQ